MGKVTELDIITEVMNYADLYATKWAYRMLNEQKKEDETAQKMKKKLQEIFLMLDQLKGENNHETQTTKEDNGK